MNFKELKEEIYNDCRGMVIVKFIFSKDYQYLMNVIFFSKDLMEDFFEDNRKLFTKFDRFAVGYSDHVDKLHFPVLFVDYMINDNGISFTRI